MELESLRYDPRPNGFVQSIGNLEYSISIEDQVYWGQLEGHVTYGRQNISMVKNGLLCTGQGHISNHQDRWPQSQKRQRSPEERLEPAQRLRRSNRLEAQSARTTTHGEAVTDLATQDPYLGSKYYTGAASETSAVAGNTVVPNDSPDNPYAGSIMISLDPRPPLEVRTGHHIPRFTVRVTITDLEVTQPTNSDYSIAVSTLHAVVSLWSADGRTASPHAVPPLLTGQKDATLDSVVSAAFSERRAEATFSGLSITRPGHYRIRISIMETPVPERGEDDDVSIGSPRQLLSIESRPIHAHGFAI